ncbi:MAG: aminotransferase class I/II-fold pyridoxal phosphate-dependent enzyme, partial [Cyclobacteriaceae bacterium]|nr:aminotransferase class I/II-fold pyridoxal phosphate-dependent enzyme [Cyclobacteriaceae bacterium]
KKEYLPVSGLRELREVTSDFYKRNYQLKISADNILIGPGSKELLYNLQVVCDYDEILLPTPSWVSYEPQGVITNKLVTWIPTKEEESWKIKPETIDRICREQPEKGRIIIFNYPSNPLGVTYSKTELEALSKVFRANNILVVADEIYGELQFDGNHSTIATYYPEGTIISTGLSKWAGAGGWRLGIFIIPDELKSIREAMAVLASETFTSTSTPIQYAAMEAFKKNDRIDMYVKDCRNVLTAVGLYCFNELKKAGVTMPKPEGGFYIYPNFNKWKEKLQLKGIVTSGQLCEVLLRDTGVALLPGNAFGHPDDLFTARLSFVDFDGEKTLQYLNDINHVELDGEFVKSYCPRIITSIKVLISWLKNL